MLLATRFPCNLAKYARVFRERRLFRLKFHFTVRLSRDSSPRKQSWPLMVYYFSTATCDAAITTAFPAMATKFLRLFTDVRCTSSNTENKFLSFSFFYLRAHTEACTHHRLLLSLSKSEFSASTMYLSVRSRALLRFGRLSLSRVFPSLFHAVSSSFPSFKRVRVPSLFLGLFLRWWQRATSNRGESKGSLDQEGRETNAE